MLIKGKQLASATVTQTNMAADSVGSTQIVNASVGNGKIATAAVTADKIDAAAVTEAKIATAAVTADKIGAAAVTEAKIATNAVTADKILNGEISDAKVNSTIIVASGAYAMTGDLSLGTHKITNLADPTAGSDGATKSYVDSLSAGLRDFKESARVATVASLPSSFSANALTSAQNGAIAIDGVTLSVTDRVLVKDQGGAGTAGESPDYNGIYVVTDTGSAGSPWILTRSADADESSEVSSGMYLYVSEGTVNATSSWVLSTPDPIVLNSTALSFAQFSGAGQLTAGQGISITANTISADLDSTMEFYNNGIRLSANAGGSGTTVSNGSIDVNVDNSTIQINAQDELELGSGAAGTALSYDAGTSSLNVKYDNSTIVLSAGSSSLMVGAGAAGDGLTYNNGALDINVNAQNLELVADTLQFSAAAAGPGLQGGAGNPLGVGAGAGITVSSTDVSVSYGTAAAMQSIDAGDSASAGSSSNAARIDHQHAVSTASNPLNDMAAVGVSNDVGSSTKLIRADHVHAAPRPDYQNKSMQALASGTSTGALATNTSIASSPALGCYVGVLINGISYEVGNGSTSTACYFADPATPGTAKSFANIVAGDKCYWNSQYAGFALDSNDRVDFLYEAFL